VKGWESEVRILAKACGEMSRGDGAIVACHEMLGTTPPEKGRSRRVRCDGVSQLQEAVHHDEKHFWIAPEGGARMETRQRVFFVRPRWFNSGTPSGRAVIKNIPRVNPGKPWAKLSCPFGARTAAVMPPSVKIN
jgi:hypothetical protein